METPVLRFPSILPSSNTLINTERPLSVKLTVNAYEQWRTDIHRQLEEDLQRQVRELIEQTEREERLAKLNRQNLRVGQSPSSSPAEVQSDDQWNEIDRRNEHVLRPINGTNSVKSSTRFSLYPHHQFNRNCNKPFNLNSYQNYRPRRQSSQRTDEPIITMNPSLYLDKYLNKQSSLNTFNSDSSFLFGNSIVKSNKAEILNVFQQKLMIGDQSNIYVDKYGVTITEDGPFWPDDYRILHPPPKLLNRNLIEKEFYLSPSSTNTIHRQTFDNQPAIYKYPDTLKHCVTVYDMDKSSRQQPIKCPDDENISPQLIFESRFEGGNLRQVKRIGQFDYELILRPDLYTRRHTQWYFFRVQNMIANLTYRFRIINLTKKNSLYNEGMQILLFSDVDSKKECRGWRRVGHHINYSESKHRTFSSLLERDMNYYELDFQFEFGHSGDTCYIAHCYPYTFSDLKDDLDHLAIIRPRHIFRRDVLCESRAGNSCFIITVTDESVPLHKKKIVFITARIHPGETNSSYMMRGLLEFITSNDKLAQKLRSQLIFKIIPMLNPDGVIVGNYRCSLSGKDMNRNFRHPRKQTFPIIYHIKELILNLQKEQREILAFCDLHGHSRRSNVFAYGCDGCDGPQPDMRQFLNARVLPFIMSKTAPEMFAFDYCKFHIHRCKESTGRVVMWKEMSIKNSFTLEASFAGTSIVEKPCHFNIHDLEKFGQSICQSLGQYLDVLSDSTRLDSIFVDITKNLFLKLDKDKSPLRFSPEENESIVPIDSLANCLELLTQYHNTINPHEGTSSSDSDSDPEGGELPNIIYRKEAKLTKKKSKKSRVDKSLEERIQKANNKREMENTSRMLPQRGSLFTSKYANRTGNGLPIFTTERALERRHQKRSDSVLQDGSYDRATDDRDDPESVEDFFVPRKSSGIVHRNETTKRTSSLICVPFNEFPSSIYEPSRNHQLIVSPTTIKRLSQRRAPPPRRSPQETTKFNNVVEMERTKNISPSIITMPNLIDCATRFNRPISLTDHHVDIPQDSTLLRSFPKHETSLTRNRNCLNTQNTNILKRTKDSFLQQPFNSTDSLLRERPITAKLENNYQFDTIGFNNQIIKKRLV